jgi:peptidoglycan/xylan/chitin deacetylase (PgdA/CDA1 family)
MSPRGPLSRARLLAAGLLCLAAFPAAADHYNKRNRQGAVYWHGDLDKPEIALTFDDGPNEPYTSQILQVLKDNGVKATFFMVGMNIQKEPEAARAVVEAGHAVGNHSWSHPDMILEGSGTVARQLSLTDEALFRATGRHSRLFRPPYGADDPLTVRAVERMGYVMVKWSVSSRDWKRPGADRIVTNVLNHTGNGAILLMHDGDKAGAGDRSQTVEALKRIIPKLKEEGFTFVTVPELLGVGE